MDLLSVIMIAVGLSMDAFSVAVSDGLTVTKIKITDAFKTGLFFGVFQFAMPCIGYFAASFASGLIEKVDHWVAFGLLAFLGIRMIIEAIKSQNAAEEIPKDPFKLSTLTLMAIATSIDALAVGISFAAVGTPILMPALIIGVVAFAFSFAGVYLGKRFGAFLGNKAEIIGGAILIIIGVKILIEHLM